MDKAAADDRTKVDLFLDLFYRMMMQANEIDQRPREFVPGMLLHRAEIHTVQAIGKLGQPNMNRLAAHMGVTKGAASQMVSKLAAKGLVRKERPASSGREILLELTEAGWHGYRQHEAFHDSIHDVFRDHFGDDLDQALSRSSEVVKELSLLLEKFDQRNL